MASVSVSFAPTPCRRFTVGRNTFSIGDYQSATRAFVPRSGPATRLAEERANNTGKLDPLVDPAEYGVIRLSLPRVEKLPNGFFQLTVGTPMAVETRVDTTGSMGGNVDVVLRVLPDAFGLCGHVLPGYDVQMALGIFGDCWDRFVLCRPQFEMEAHKLVQQLSLMAPQRGGGGNGGEDPHYGIFGAAYLTRSYANSIGLKRYDFTLSDEPARDDFSESQLRRIFGEQVFEKARENGFDINSTNLPSTSEVVTDLLTRAHAFFLEVETGDPRTHSFWTRVLGHERVVVLPRTELLPQVKAVIIGLTEGTLELGSVADFLQENNVSREDARAITRSVSNIPIGAQSILPNFDRRPQKGDVFREKPDVWNETNLWPIDPRDVPEEAFANDAEEEPGPAWL